MATFDFSAPLSPAQAFARGYEAGDRQRLQGIGPDVAASKVPDSFSEEWEQGFRAGLRGEPSPTIFS